jgi:DNA-3-methyladenine glycosylase II
MIELRVPSDFDFALSARVLRRSEKNPVDRVTDDGAWSRVIVLSRGPALVSARQDGDRLIVETGRRERPADRARVARFVARLFSIELDLAPFWRRLRRESGFAELARRCHGLHPQRYPSLFEALVNGVACQQVSLASGLTRLGRLAERFGPRTPDGARFGSPDPAGIATAPVSTLRAAGLSTRRAEALRELARMPLDRVEAELETLSDERARALLLELPSVGPWTADYVLLRGLGRLDVFPSGDVGAAKTLGRILGRALDPRAAGQIAARFAPLRGMLYFCMLGSVLSTRKSLSTRGPVRT